MSLPGASDSKKPPLAKSGKGQNCANILCLEVGKVRTEARYAPPGVNEGTGHYGAPKNPDRSVVVEAQNQHYR